MDGCVFQVKGENRKKGQFRDTMEKLLVYSAEHHNKQSKTLAVLFNDLVKPTSDKPKELTKAVIMGDDGKETTAIG